MAKKPLHRRKARIAGDDLAAILERSLAAERVRIDSPEQLWRWQVDYRQRLREAMRLDLPAIYRPPSVENLRHFAVGPMQVEHFDLETDPDRVLPVELALPAGRLPELVLIRISAGRPTPMHDGGKCRLDAVSRYLLEHNCAVIQPSSEASRSSAKGAIHPPRGSSTSADRLAAAFLHLNRTYAGAMTHDLIRLVDAVNQRDDMAEAVLVVMGGRSAAEPAAWLTALDQRVRGLVVAPWPISVRLDSARIPPPRFVGEAVLGAAEITLRAICPRDIMLTGIDTRAERELLESLSGIYAACGVAGRITYSTELEPDPDTILQFITDIH